MFLFDCYCIFFGIDCCKYSVCYGNKKIECLLEGFVRLLNYFGVELKCR